MCRKTGTVPARHILNSYRLDRKSFSFKNILVTQNCNCKVSKKSKNKSHIIKPAKLNVPILSRKSKSFVLTPPTLTIAADKTLDTKKSSSPVASENPTTTCTSTEKKEFNDGGSDRNAGKLNDCKSSITNESTESEKGMDTLSFKDLRTQFSKLCSPDATTASNKRESSSSSSCSVQARMEPSLPGDCDDTSIEELASYFDLFVHIPKKMSSMAEMMYI